MKQQDELTNSIEESLETMLGLIDTAFRNKANGHHIASSCRKYQDMRGLAKDMGIDVKPYDTIYNKILGLDKK